MLSYHAPTSDTLSHNLENNKRLLKTRTHNVLESLNAENRKQQGSKGIHSKPSFHLVSKISIALSRKISSKLVGDHHELGKPKSKRGDNDSVSDDSSSHDDSSGTVAKQDTPNRRKSSLAHAPNNRISITKPAATTTMHPDHTNTTPDNAEDATVEWNCVDSRSIKPITVVSSMIIEKILEIVAGKLGRILCYHIPPLVALKISQQIMCDLNPMDGIHYDASVVDFAEQCLRNNLVSEGISHISQITSLFFSSLDGGVHDPPYFAARALLVLGHLQLVEASYTSAQRTFDAAERILSLEGWNPAEHHELRVIQNYRWEATTKLTAAMNSTTTAAAAAAGAAAANEQQNHTNKTGKQSWSAVNTVFHAVGMAKTKKTSSK